MPSLGMFEGTGKRSDTAGLLQDSRVQLWTRRKQLSQELRSLHESWWTKYWSWYRARVTELTDPVDWWRSNEVAPEIFKVIETILPRHIIGMFSGPEWFTVQGTQGQGELYEKQVQSLLMYSVERMKLFPKAYEALKYCLIMGHVWGKMTWKQETESRVRDVPVQLTDDSGFPSLDASGAPRFTVQEQITDELTYDDPEFDWVDNFHLWPDPTGHGRWFIEQMDVSLDDLLERNTQADGVQIYHNLELLEQTAENSGDQDSDYSDEQNVVESLSYDSRRLSRDSRAVRLWQCWGWVPPEQRAPDGVAWRLQVIANGNLVIRDRTAPTPDLRPPYFPIKSIPIPRRLYGESIIRYTGPLADQMNRIENWRMDEVLLNIWGQFIINRQSGVTDNKLFLQPGGALFVDGNVNDVFAVMPRKPVLPEAYTESANKREQIESTSAATPLVQGVMETNRATAREIQTRSLQGNARFELMTMWLDYTFKKEVLTRAFKLYQRHLPPDRLIRIVGQPDENVVLDIADIQTPVDIVIHSGIFAFNREDKVQDLSQMLLALTNSPQLAQYGRFREILAEIFTAMGWRNPQRFLKTEEEATAEAQAAFQQQAQLALGQSQLETESQKDVDVTKTQAETGKDLAVTALKGNFDLARERIRAAASTQRARFGGKSGKD